MPNPARRVGRAFQAAIAQVGPEDDLEIEGPSLANARRRNVFRYLCLRPCARVGEMSAALGLSHATIRWHEKNLVENGYLEMDALHVFPNDLVDSADADLFGLLSAPGRSEVLLTATRDPGVSLMELAASVGVTRQSASKLAGELVEAGLLSDVEDGRFRRLYPTDLLARKREANLPRAEAFVDRILRRLAADGLLPELLRRDEVHAIFRFGSGTRWVILDLPTDPYATAWSSRS